MEFINKTKEVLELFGKKIPEISTLSVNKISEITGQEQSLFVGKIISFLILAIVLFISTKITNKLAKFTIMLLSIVLIISVGYSFFS